MLEKAVTWIIIMIVVVFDPLAVIMLLAAQMTFGWQKNGAPKPVEATPANPKEPAPENLLNRMTDRLRRRLKSDTGPNFEGVRMPDGTWVQTGPSFAPQQPEYEADDGPLTQDQIDQINQLVKSAQPAQDPTYYVVDDTTDEEEHPFRGHGQVPSMPMTASYNQPKEPESTSTPTGPTSSLEFEFVDDEPEEIVADGELTQAEVDAILSAVEEAERKEKEELANRIKEIVAEPESEATVEPTPEPVPPAIETPAPPRVLEAAPGLNRGVMYAAPAPAPIQADNVLSLGKPARSDFGGDFPADPNKGDVYLRTDYLPNRLFKFNGQKWIEVDRTQTNVYTYEDQYIQHLITEIESGKYDPEMLTDIERDRIAEYLSKNNAN
jgi:hypothetical protein